ncbi:MAG: SCO family protein, partial [Gammaproteobacteria bacterium]
MAPVRPFNRRKVLVLSASWFAAGGLLAGCSPQVPTFKSTDITGAAFARDLKLTDHTGQVRTMADFRGKAVVVFFGFTQCPDVCPTSMQELAEVKQMLGKDGDRLQGIFVTVDPERDTPEVLSAY